MRVLALVLVVVVVMVVVVVVVELVVVVVVVVAVVVVVELKPLGSGKVRLVQQPFPYLPWHLSAPEQSRSQVREGSTRITVFLKLLEVRVVGLRSRQESNSIWVRRNSLVTQS